MIQESSFIGLAQTQSLEAAQKWFVVKTLHRRCSGVGNDSSHDVSTNLRNSQGTSKEQEHRQAEIWRKKFCENIGTLTNTTMNRIKCNKQCPKNKSIWTEKYRSARNQTRLYAMQSLCKEDNVAAQAQQNGKKSTINKILRCKYIIAHTEYHM